MKGLQSMRASTNQQCYEWHHKVCHMFPAFAGKQHASQKGLRAADCRISGLMSNVLRLLDSTPWEGVGSQRVEGGYFETRWKGVSLKRGSLVSWFPCFPWFPGFLISLVSWFLGFFGFLVSWFLWFPGFLVSWFPWFPGFLGFLVSWFPGFLGFLVSAGAPRTPSRP